MNLKGAKLLSKTEQKAIIGGVGNCTIACGSGVLIGNVQNCGVDIDAVCANQSGPNFQFCTCTGGNYR